MIIPKTREEEIYKAQEDALLKEKTAVEETKRELEKEEINSNTFHIAKILQTQLMEAIPLMKIDDLKPKVEKIQELIPMRLSEAEPKKN